MNLYFFRPGSQVVRHSSAKGIYGGSIPPQASKQKTIQNNLLNGFLTFPYLKKSLNLLSLTKKNTLAFARYFFMVPRRGLEPPRIAPLVPKTNAYTNSATWA